MSEIVQERGGHGVARARGGQALPERQGLVQGAQARHQLLHHERRADRVGKTRVLGTRKRHAGDAELANTPQPLQLATLQKPHHQGFFFALEGHQSMNGISKDHASFRASEIAPSGGL